MNSYDTFVANIMNNLAVMTLTGFKSQNFDDNNYARS